MITTEILKLSQQHSELSTYFRYIGKFRVEWSFTIRRLKQNRILIISSNINSYEQQSEDGANS